jgi:hypothetical protein
MAMNAIHCSVLGGDVTVVTDFEGTVAQVICPEYDTSRDVCRLKERALEGGRLAQFLERAAAHGLDSRSTSCHLRMG